jgi:hypothetical protein
MGDMEDERRSGSSPLKLGRQILHKSEECCRMRCVAKFWLHTVPATSHCSDRATHEEARHGIVPEISLWVRLAVVVATKQRLARESENELHMKYPGRLPGDSKTPIF